MALPLFIYQGLLVIESRRSMDVESGWIAEFGSVRDFNTRIIKLSYNGRRDGTTVLRGRFGEKDGQGVGARASNTACL